MTVQQRQVFDRLTPLVEVNVRALQFVAKRAGTLVFAVGAESMIDSLRELAPELGIRPEDVLTNRERAP